MKKISEVILRGKALHQMIGFHLPHRLCQSALSGGGGGDSPQPTIHLISLHHNATPTTTPSTTAPSSPKPLTSTMFPDKCVFAVCIFKSAAPLRLHALHDISWPKRGSVPAGLPCGCRNNSIIRPKRWRTGVLSL